MKNAYRPIILILVLTLFSAPLPANLEDWTLEDVLQKIEEANGGLESIESVTNARFLGEVEGDDSSYDFVLLKKRPNKMRIHVKLYQRSIENIFDGNKGWRRFTQKGFDKVVPIEGKELDQMSMEADFDGPMIGSVPEGMERRLSGVERIDRVDYFVIELESDYELSRHYIDSRTFREHKSIKLSKPEEGEPQETVSYFHDNERHGQIWVSHRVERHLPDGKREIVLIKDVEINPGILDRTFNQPEERNPVPGN